MTERIIRLCAVTHHQQHGGMLAMQAGEGRADHRRTARDPNILLRQVAISASEQCLDENRPTMDVLQAAPSDVRPSQRSDRDHQRHGQEQSEC